MDEDIVQEEILKRLHDFGESAIGKGPKKKKTTSQACSEQIKPLDVQTRSQKEKNRKRTERRKRKREMKTFQNEEEIEPKKLNNIEKIAKMFDISDRLNNVKHDEKSPDIGESETVKHSDFVDKDISAQKQQNKRKNKNKKCLVEKEVFIFKDPKKLVKKKIKPKVEVEIKDKVEEEVSEQPVFNMDEAKFEVRKLGITGFEEKRQEDSVVDLLISLGAKPPKKKYVNYKELQKQRKEEIIKDKEKREMDRKLGILVKKGGFTKKSKKDANDISIRDGQIGRYEHGTQYVKKRDLR